MELLILLFDLFLCWLVGNFWYGKGYSYWLGFFVALFLTPLIGFLIALFLPDRKYY